MTDDRRQGYTQIFWMCYLIGSSENYQNISHSDSVCIECNAFGGVQVKSLVKPITREVNVEDLGYIKLMLRFTGTAHIFWCVSILFIAKKHILKIF